VIAVSVVIATYNRSLPLKKLLAKLAAQDVATGTYEVVVVDDGSDVDPKSMVESFSRKVPITFVRQANAGVAVARQRGVERAHGKYVVFLDDDMLVFADFVRKHLEAHGDAVDRVVMGELLPDAHLPDMPLFERFHAEQLARVAQRHAKTGAFRGVDVYTGNLSMPRALFLRAGGFDPAFFIEDVELGVRLERAGARFVFSREAVAVHASDHTSLSAWLARSEKEGRDWVKLARKHPAEKSANPWRFFVEANPLSKSIFAAVVAVPKVAPWLARAAWNGAEAVDAIGFDRATLSAMTLVYGIQYFRGVRVESGTLKSALDGYRAARQPS
jgi:GT2 family glycosyltransferase